MQDENTPASKSLLNFFREGWQQILNENPNANNGEVEITTMKGVMKQMTALVFWEKIIKEVDDNIENKNTTLQVEQELLPNEDLSSKEDDSLYQISGTYLYRLIFEKNNWFHYQNFPSISELIDILQRNINMQCNAHRNLQMQLITALQISSSPIEEEQIDTEITHDSLTDTQVNPTIEERNTEDNHTEFNSDSQENNTAEIIPVQEDCSSVEDEEINCSESQYANFSNNMPTFIPVNHQMHHPMYPIQNHCIISPVHCIPIHHMPLPNHFIPIPPPNLLPSQCIPPPNVFYPPSFPHIRVPLIPHPNINVPKNQIVFMPLPPQGMIYGTPIPHIIPHPPLYRPPRITSMYGVQYPQHHLNSREEIVDIIEITPDNEDLLELKDCENGIVEFEYKSTENDNDNNIDSSLPILENTNVIQNIAMTQKLQCPESQKLDGNCDVNTMRKNIEPQYPQTSKDVSNTNIQDTNAKHKDEQRIRLDDEEKTLLEGMLHNKKNSHSFKVIPYSIMLRADKYIPDDWDIPEPPLSLSNHTSLGYISGDSRVTQTDSTSSYVTPVSPTHSTVYFTRDNATQTSDVETEFNMSDDSVQTDNVYVSTVSRLHL